MFINLITKLIGSKNQRLLKSFNKKVNQINELESEYKQLNDIDFKNKTKEFKKDYKDEKITSSELELRAYALVREACLRTLNMRPFDVQLIGALVLNEGKIAEMRTGEGKTLTATLTAYLNSIMGNSVHIVTVNDYLAKRDSENNRKLFEFLGLTVGANLANMNPTDKKKAYLCNILYGTNNEFGFDYLRDNMAFSQSDKVQSNLDYAIVDEVDSILIDEARTPLIISGPSQDNTNIYIKINKLAKQLVLIKEKLDIKTSSLQTKEELEEQEKKLSIGDFTIDEKAKQIYLTERGQETIEKLLKNEGLINSNDSLYNATNISLLYHVQAALRAKYLFIKDVDYIISENQIVIVDEHTGRIMQGRRWSEGLHQAIEAKEGIKVQNENQTLASITFQNYFRLYEKLSGMTGTADTESFEFMQTYGLETVVIPTNKPMIRDDRADAVYLSTQEKFDAIIAGIKECKEKKQPVLVGTISIEISEYLSKLLKKEKIDHKVLNAKFHDQEAEIIANAGKLSAVTIATNMAGRGTDIVLGGSIEKTLEKINKKDKRDIDTAKYLWQKNHDEVISVGGLHILGTERHESRRIDNQLRGRSGRQGDPGSSKFYLSMQDNLMRIFASDKVTRFMQKIGLEKGESITHPWVTKAIENAQKKVESRNFDIRKQLLEFDDVANEQRKVIYEQRNKLLEKGNITETIKEIEKDIIDNIISIYISDDSAKEDWNIQGLEKELLGTFNIEIPLKSWIEDDKDFLEADIISCIHEQIELAYQEKKDMVGSDVIEKFEKTLMLQSLDQHWKEHLCALDYLKKGIHLRGFAQKNPKQEYKREAFTLFSDMLDNFKFHVVTSLAKVEVKNAEELRALEIKKIQREKEIAKRLELNVTNMTSKQTKTFIKTKKIGRNQLCTCGSGKKYKHCCGKLNRE